jgi:hypothetical protein
MLPTPKEAVAQGVFMSLMRRIEATPEGQNVVYWPLDSVGGGMYSLCEKTSAVDSSKAR